MSNAPSALSPPLLFGRSACRGIGQIVFQQNAVTGLLFVAGIALGNPIEALGILAGALIGTAVAWLLRYDKEQLEGGIYGFNPALVGIATLFFFQPGVTSIAMLVVGCAVATVVTMLARTHLPFPTYTAPFILATWGIFFLGKALGVPMVDHSQSTPLLPTPSLPFAIEATAHGVGQIMFQGTLWAGVLFLVGLALSDWKHAAWVLAGSVVGMLVVSYHLEASTRAANPETLVDGPQFASVQLGLYGYNATLAAVALFLWRRSLIPAILGILLSVPLTELLPRLGIPALTAPFVLATWIVLGFGHLDGLLLKENPTKS